MKGSYEELKQTLSGATEAAEATAEEGAGEVAAGGSDGAIHMDNIVNEEVRGILEERIRESIRETFEPKEEPSVSWGEVANNAAEALSDPTIKKMLTEAWYGPEGASQNQQIQEQVTKQAETETPETNENQMFTGKDYDKDDMELDKEKLHGLMVTTLQSAEESAGDMTAEEMVTYHGMIHGMIQNVANMQSDMTVSEMVEYEEEHRDVFKNELDKLIDQM